MVVFTEMNHPDRPNAQEVYWRAEYYCDMAETRNFPVGVAYIVCVSEHEHGTAAQMNFIMVADQWKGQGIGGKIIKACLAKWLNLQPTGGMDHRGKRLVAKYFPRFALSEEGD